MNNKYKRKYKWAISTLFRGDSDIIELFIMWYHDKVDYLTIGLHNPSTRIQKHVEDILQKNNIKNVKLRHYHNELYHQGAWVLDIYTAVLTKNKDIQIYGHVDIDEFIYRFDLIEENYEKIQY